MKKYRCNIQGFTLLELLVTLSVLLILISIGVSSYSGIFAQQELIQKTERLYHFLRLAQSQAVKLNTDVYVHFCQLEETGEWRVAMAEQSSCDCFTASSCLLNGKEVVQELVDGETLSIPSSDVPYGDKKGSFGPMLHSVDGGSVTLSDTNGNTLKVIQATRRLMVCSPDEDQLGYKKC